MTDHSAEPSNLNRDLVGTDPVQNEAVRPERVYTFDYDGAFLLTPSVFINCLITSGLLFDLYAEGLEQILCKTELEQLWMLAIDQNIVRENLIKAFSSGCIERSRFEHLQGLLKRNLKELKTSVDLERIAYCNPNQVAFYDARRLYAALDNQMYLVTSEAESFTANLMERQQISRYGWGEVFVEQAEDVDTTEPVNLTVEILTPAVFVGGLSTEGA